MATKELHEHNLIEIFSRIPTKSVGRFRCLSKSWNICLSSEQFIKLHLNRKSHNLENLLFINEEYDSVNLITTPIKDDVISTEVELQKVKCWGSCYVAWKKVCGSCNGLVLLLNNHDGMSVVNPITREQVNTEVIPRDVVKNNSGLGYGFGYDSSTNGYKIIVHYEDSFDEDDPKNTYVIVYSLKKRFWKRLGVSPYQLQQFGNGAYLDGSIHWVANRGRNSAVITAFDVAKEVFFEIPLPDPANADYGKMSIFTNTFIHRGCLSVLVSSYTNKARMSFWIMKEYGLRESWTKITMYTAGYKDSWESRTLCFNGDLEKSLVINLKNGTVKDMVVDGMSIQGETFVDSLVSPC